MGTRNSKCENNDDVETITVNNQPYQPNSTVIRNEPTSSNSISSALFNAIKSWKTYLTVNSTEERAPIPEISSKRVEETVEATYNLLYNETYKKHYLFRRKKVERNINMLKEFLQVLYIPITHVPIKRPYVESLLRVEQYEIVRSLLRNKKFNDMYEIDQIVHVWNPYIFLQYQINADKYKEDTESQILFHGTHLENLESIVTNNFDWRKIKTAKFGWGVSFANNPWYASHYSTRKLQSENCVMIIARVLIGQKFYGNSSTIVPLNGDTSINHDGQVLVKFDDACFYPEFIISFKKRTNVWY